VTGSEAIAVTAFWRGSGLTSPYPTCFSLWRNANAGGTSRSPWRTVHGPGGARPVRNRQDARRLAQADTDYGAEAYPEARQRD
jgi:hypothetical protein